MVSRRSSTETSKEVSLLKEEAAQKKNALSLKGSRTDEAGTQTNPSRTPNEILKVDLKNDNVHSFNTRWDVTVIAMKMQPDQETLWKCCYCQLQQSERVKLLLSLNIQDTVQRVSRLQTEKDGGGLVRPTETS